MVAKQPTLLSDEYERKARLTPALVSILPASLLIASLGTKYSVAAGIVTGPLTAIGFTYMLAEIGRDWGKKKQQQLFESWGGKPTTVKLRHRDGSMNPLTLERIHDAAKGFIGRTLPTRVEEHANPVAADIVYESVGDYLSEQTRDKKRFPLIRKELVSYGYRRNLWGMKPFAITVAVCCLIVQLFLIVRELTLDHIPSPTLWVATFVNLSLAAMWVAIVRPSWVRVPADAYAKNLLVAFTSIVAAKPKKPPKKA